MVFRSNKFLVIVTVAIVNIVDMRLCYLFQFSFAFVDYLFHFLLVLVGLFLILLFVCFLWVFRLLKSDYLV